MNWMVKLSCENLKQQNGVLEYAKTQDGQCLGKLAVERELSLDMAQKTDKCSENVLKEDYLRATEMDECNLLVTSKVELDEASGIITAVIGKSCDVKTPDDAIKRWEKEGDLSGLVRTCSAEDSKECFKVLPQETEISSSSFSDACVLCECTTCYMKFRTQTGLLNHICTGGRKKNHICEVCFKTFAERFTLNRHMASHASEKTVRCDLCLKTFTRKDSLVRHLHVHKKECKTCLKIFPTEHELSSHVCECTPMKSQQCEVEEVSQENGVCCEINEKSDLLMISNINTFKKLSQASDLHISGTAESDKSFQDSAQLSSVLGHVICKSELQDGDAEKSAQESESLESLLSCKVEKPNGYEVEEDNKCKTCLKIFATESELSQHVLTCVCNKSYTCKMCFKMFDKNLHFTNHMSAHANHVRQVLPKSVKSQKQEKETTNKCEKCARYFLTKWELLGHMRNHTVLDSHQFGKRFTFKAHVTRQMPTHTSKMFLYSKQPAGEYNQHLGIVEKESTTEKHVLHTNADSCNPAQGSSITFMDQDLEESLKEVPLESNLCYVTLKESDQNIEDLTQSSNVSGNLLMTCKVEVPDDDNNFENFGVDEFLREFHSCNTCSMRFATKMEFSRHLGTHRSEKFHVCKMCFRKFPKKYTLNRHMATHVSEKTIECTECGKKFARKDYLTRHLRMFHADKSYKCDKCGKTFWQKHQLTFHMEDNHKAPESDQCTVCFQKYPRGQFSTHMLTHVSDELWECPLCSKTYTKKNNLLWHLSSCHEEGKLHECRKCLKTFKARLDLRRHTLTDKSEASYDCVEKGPPHEGEKYKNSESETNGSLYDPPDKLTEEMAITDTGEVVNETGILACENSGNTAPIYDRGTSENDSSSSAGKEWYDCQACPQKFSTKEALLTHRLYHKQKLYKCKVCAKEFIQGHHLSRHMICHGGEKAFECEICPEKFARKENLTRHLLNHVGERPHECETCLKRFTMKCDLTMHMLIHTGQRSHACTLCPKKFARKSHLSRHMLTHTGEKPHTCGICPKTFARRTDLIMHEATHKGEKADECNVCHKKFARRDNLAKHLLTHKGLKPHECTICSWKFARKYNLAKHMLTHTGVREHECEICAKKFVTKSNLFTHLLTHTREKLFECEICRKNFTTKSNLRVHTLLHKEITELECEVCTKKFRNKYRLARHLSVTHMGSKKKHSCEVCLKKFTSRFLVQRHMLSHTGEKSHECKICSKRFGQKETLTRHMLIHSGEKPHECTICFKKFTQRMALSKHLLIHTGELPYECDFCPRKFTHRSYLSRHLLTHSEEGAADECEEMVDSV